MIVGIYLILIIYLLQFEIDAFVKAYTMFFPKYNIARIALINQAIINNQITSQNLEAVYYPPDFKDFFCSYLTNSIEEYNDFDKQMSLPIFQNQIADAFNEINKKLKWKREIIENDLQNLKSVIKLAHYILIFKQRYKSLLKIKSLSTALGHMKIINNVHLFTSGIIYVILNEFEDDEFYNLSRRKNNSTLSTKQLMYEDVERMFDKKDFSLAYNYMKLPKTYISSQKGNQRVLLIHNEHQNEKQLQMFIACVTDLNLIYLRFADMFTALQNAVNSSSSLVDRIVLANDWSVYNPLGI